MHSDAGSNGCDGDNDTSREDSPSNLYAPAKYVPDRTVRQPMTDDNRGGTRGELEDLNDAMEELRQLQADRYDTVEDFEGRADWDKDWTLISSGREKEHDTTLVALEKDFKSVPEHKKKDNGDEDDGPDTTLDDFNDDEEERPDRQLTLDQAIDEPQEDDEEIDYFCIITSKTVDAEGIDPDDNPVAHDPEGTAWDIGRLYRDRRGVETAFRDKKHTFAAKTRSRDLGYRRFLWMMETLLYNG